GHRRGRVLFCHSEQRERDRIENESADEQVPPQSCLPRQSLTREKTGHGHRTGSESASGKRDFCGGEVFQRDLDQQEATAPDSTQYHQPGPPSPRRTRSRCCGESRHGTSVYDAMLEFESIIIAISV